MPNGVSIPLGKAEQIQQQPGGYRYGPNFSEYIVYDADQVRMRYIVQIAIKK